MRAQVKKRKRRNGMKNKVLDRDERTFEMMLAITEILNALCENEKMFYTIRTVYSDYGQGLQWTTIVRKGGDLGDVQILSPRQWDMIEMARTLEDITNIVTDIREDKYFNEGV